MDKHELQAEINARRIMLNQTQEQAIVHLEYVVSAILSCLSSQMYTNVLTNVQEMENNIDAEVLGIVRLAGETENGIKSKRQVWREELIAMEAQLADASDQEDYKGDF